MTWVNMQYPSISSMVIKVMMIIISLAASCVDPSLMRVQAALIQRINGSTNPPKPLLLLLPLPYMSWKSELSMSSLNRERERETNQELPSRLEQREGGACIKVSQLKSN